MKYLLLVCSILLFSSVATAQTGWLFIWDYSAADIAANNTSRFEIRVDNGVWTNVGMTVHTPGTFEAPVPDSPDGTYQFDVRGL